LSNTGNRQDLARLTDEIIDSYRRHPATQYIGSTYLPNRETIISLVNTIREVLFPGFFGRQNIVESDLPFHISSMLGTVRDMLFDQVRRSLRHRHQRTGKGECPDCDATAAAITDEFLGSIPRLRGILATDAQAAFDGDPAAGSIDEIIFCYPGYLAVTIYRIAHELQRLGVPLIPRIMTEYAHSLTGIDIHPGAEIGEYFFIDHGTGVVVGETTVIGTNVRIYQGVTLGALSTRGGQSLRGTKRHPTIQDGVLIYPNASILGGDTVIGQGATINGNVFITQSVPPHTRVSVKHPELQYRNRRPREFVQEAPPDFQI
jgi:serine O-acetyltransferase